jgi:sarcosine oxidase subunit beta
MTRVALAPNMTEVGLVNTAIFNHLGGELPKSADVGVIGGGVNGAATAFQLAKRGVKRVLLLERRQIGAGATGKSGALVRAHYSNVSESQLTLESLKIFWNWESEVGFGSPRFEKTGFFRLVKPEDTDKLKANVEAQQAIGVDTRLVDPYEINQIEPLVRTDDLTLAAYESDSGYADPNATTFGYIEGAVHYGAIVRTQTEVTGIITQDGKVTGVETSAGTVATESIVLAGGAWADRLLTPIDVDLPLEPHRVRVAVFRWPAEMDQHRKHAVVIDSTNHAWLRPEGIASTLIGMEHAHDRIDPDRFDESVEWEYVQRCKATLAGRFPIFEHATMRGCWSGVVMQSKDNHPIIGKAAEVDGLLLMTGDSGSSFKTAPATGIVLAEWIIDGAPKLMDMHPFRPSRFAEGQPWVDEFAYDQTKEVTISR